MTGKQIAANLRANRDKWTRNFYHNEGKYCVLGLKLHELGVTVEGWSAHRQSMPVLHFNFVDDDKLRELQRMNDRPCSGMSDADVFTDLLAYCEKNGDVDFPIEAFAEFLKSQEAPRS